MPPLTGTSEGLGNAIRELNLETYVLELEVNGLTVVPPEVHGFGMGRVDRMVEIILERAEAMTGSPFSLNEGPGAELKFPSGRASTFSEEGGKPSQFLIQTARQHRSSVSRPRREPCSGDPDPSHDRPEGDPLQLAQLLRQVARRLRLRPRSGVARGPKCGPAAVGTSGTDLEHQLVPHRLHQRRRCFGVRPRLPPLRFATGPTGCRPKGSSGRGGKRLGHRLSRSHLARCLSAADPRNAALDRQLLQAHDDHFAREHSGRLPARSGGRVRRPRICSKSWRASATPSPTSSPASRSRPRSAPAQARPAFPKFAHISRPLLSAGGVAPPRHIANMPASARLASEQNDLELLHTNSGHAGLGREGPGFIALGSPAPDRVPPSHHKNGP